MKISEKIFFLIALGNSLGAWAQDSSHVLELDAVQVKSSHLGSDYIGFDVHLNTDDLRNKDHQSLGALLNNELGISSTAYGAGASRPVIRGLDGSRVQILENGQSVSDVSNISADHADANNLGQIQEVELLRGPAALAYASGVSGGVINVINNRIAKKQDDHFLGDVNLGYETGNERKVANVNLGASSNSIVWRLDANADHAGNYKIPGFAELNGPNASWAINTGSPQNVSYKKVLPWSYSRQDSLGLGVSYLAPNGYTGISVDQIKHDYGVPTVEGSQLNQVQSRLNVEHLTQNPWNGISAFRANFYAGDYSHHELDAAGVPQTYWSSSSFGGKLEIEHQPWYIMTGKFGLQLSSAQLQATDVGSGNAAIVPSTKTSSKALYWIEESKFKSLNLLWGLRYEMQNISPNVNPIYAGGDPQFSSGSYLPSLIIDRQLGLWSYSMVADWKWGSSYGSSLGYTRSQRAPSVVELYGYGSHDSTATFIVGNSNLSPETSHDIELKIYKSVGLLQAKANLYWIHFDNYIYGLNTGSYSSANNNFSVVTTNQGAATIHGLESELSYLFSEQNLILKLFGDINRGTFDAGGNLPLQPAPRLGLGLKHELNQLTTQITYVHAFMQNHLATFEVGPTPSYNLLNFDMSYKQRIQGVNWLSYIKVSNLLNQDIRYATTPETVRLYAPQMARSLFLGLRASY